MQDCFSRPRRVLISSISALCLLLLYTGVLLSQAARSGVVNRTANLRAGPGVSYAVIGQAQQGQAVTIAGANAAGSWYQLSGGQWIAAFLVDSPTTETPAPTATAPAGTASTGATALRNANLRAGPGTNFAVVGGVTAGQALEVTGASADGGWLQLDGGNWIAAFLVDQASVTAPVAAQPQAATPTAEPAATATLVTSGNEFVVIEKRLWDPIENGGGLDGPSVHCGQGRELVVHVLDASGNRLNGVAVQVQFGARETYVTGSQGKGDGVAEFVLGGGQDVRVIRDATGRPVTSDLATGLSTNPQNIPFETLMAANYCQDEATCRHFAQNNGCNGHFSWSVVFQRQR
jgi:uncharacterized protein YraI